MGYESRLRVNGAARDELDAVLRRVPGFAGFDDKYRLYEFRRQWIVNMPDAHASLEDSGICFCDNGLGNEILSDLIRELELHFGSVVVEEV